MTVNGTDVAPIINALAQLCMSFGTMVAVIAGVYLSWRNGRKADKIDAKVDVIHQATNGMKDELVASTAKASEAQGLATGIVQGRALALAESSGTYQGLSEVAQAIKDK